MVWWSILLIVIAAIVFITLIVWGISTGGKKLAEYQKHKQEVYAQYDKLLTNLVATGYCFVNEQYLLTLYSRDELDQNKFITRPFVCFQTIAMRKQRLAIVLPQVTNHKENYYDTNIYLSNNRYYLNSEQMLIVQTSNLWFKSKEWNMSNGFLTEINQRIDEIKELIKDSMWDNNILLS